MSFILDALKKSELERQRQTIPGLVDAGLVRPRARLPIWALGISALLAVNLLVLSVVLLRGWWAPRTAPPTPPTPAMSQAPAPRPSAPAAAAGSDHFSPLDPAPEYAPEIPVAGNSAAGNSMGGDSPVGNPAAGRRMAGNPAGAAASSLAGASQPEGVGSHPVHRRDPVLTDDDYKPKDEEVLPTINELSLSGGQALPELHLDVHVFATKPAERFVYINMRKYHEGTTLEEGPTVERIRRDGVVLSYQGLRFLLPRQ